MGKNCGFITWAFRFQNCLSYKITTLKSIFKYHLVIFVRAIVPRLFAKWTLSATCKENHSLHLSIVEEIIERPQTTVFNKWIWRLIRSVRIDVAILQPNFFIQGAPKFMTNFTVVIHSCNTQQVVHAINDSLKQGKSFVIIKNQNNSKNQFENTSLQWITIENQQSHFYVCSKRPIFNKLVWIKKVNTSTL